MSVLCDIALAFNLTLNMCAAEVPITLPEEDKAVWEHEVPVADPQPPLKPDAPEVVEKVIIREVVKEVPIPAPSPEPAPPPEAPAGFNIDASNQLYSARHGGGLNSVGQQLHTRPNIEVDDITRQKAPPLAPPARYRHPDVAAGGPVDNDKILAEDRYIAGVLETSINTELDGSVIIQTSRDIFGYHGRRILLPKGSRMVCDYKSPKRIGDHRIGLVCDRVLIAESRAEIYQIAAPVGDVQGRSGITGDVDNRFIETYGSAFVLTFLSATIRAVVASARDETSTDTDDTIVSEAGEEVSERFGEITASVLQRTLNLVPIITIPQGTRVQIRPSSDWYIKAAVQ